MRQAQAIPDTTGDAGIFAKGRSDGGTEVLFVRLNGSQLSAPHRTTAAAAGQDFPPVRIPPRSGRRSSARGNLLLPLRFLGRQITQEAGHRAQGTGHWTGHWTGHSPRLAPATNGVAAAALLLRQRPSFLPAPAPGIAAAAVALGPGPWAQGLCARHTGRAAPPRRVSEEEVRIPKLRRRRRR